MDSGAAASGTTTPEFGGRGLVEPEGPEAGCPVELVGLQQINITPIA